MSKSEEHLNSLQQRLLAELSVVYENNIDFLCLTTIGDSEGVYSYVALVNITKNGGQEHLIAKIPTIEKYMANRIRRNWTAGNSDSFLHRLKEVGLCLFYDNIPAVTVIPKTVLRKPMEKDEQGVLIMQCLPNASCISIFESFSENQLIAIVDGYVALQVAASKFTEDQKRALDTGLLEGVLSTTLSQQNITKRLSIISSSYPSLKHILDELSLKFEVLVAISLFTEEKTKFQLLLHGDLHNTNILLQNGNFASFIDFQTIHYGNPCEDLIRLICLGSEIHHFVEMESLVLHKYCNEAHKHSELRSAQISLQQVTISYNRMFPLCAMWALISLHAAYDHHAHGNPSNENTDAEDKFVLKMESIAKRILHVLDNLS